MSVDDVLADVDKKAKLITIASNLREIAVYQLLGFRYCATLLGMSRKEAIRWVRDGWPAEHAEMTANGVADSMGHAIGKTVKLYNKLQGVVNGT